MADHTTPYLPNLSTLVVTEMLFSTCSHVTVSRGQTRLWMAGEIMFPIGGGGGLNGTSWLDPKPLVKGLNRWEPPKPRTFLFLFKCLVIWPQMRAVPHQGLQ